MEVNDKSGKDYRNDRQKLDKDVDSRAGGILKGIAYGVAHNGSFVAIAALSAVVSRFDVFLGIVPGTAGITHKYCNEESGYSCTGKQSDNSVGSENESYNNRHHNGDE